MEDYKTLIGSVMRTHRQAKKLSQERVADMIGISQQQYNKYENGKSVINVEMLIEVGRVLEIPMERFFDEIKNKDMVKELKKHLLYYKEIIDIVEDNPRVAEVIKFYGKNSRTLKDIDIIKLLSKLSKLPKEQRKIMFEVITKVLRG